jgi:hypothetical protein
MVRICSGSFEAIRGNKWEKLPKLVQIHIMHHGAQSVIVERGDQRIEVHTVGARELVHLSDHLTAKAEYFNAVCIEKRCLHQLDLVLDTMVRPGASTGTE